MCEMNKRLT